MRLRLRTLCLLFFLCAAGVALGEKKGCSEEQSRQAELATDNLKTWESLYDFYQKFARCDDGGVAEGISEGVAKLLANHWDAIAEFVTIAEHDKGFERFVLHHVDATIDQAHDAPKIRENAQSHCPENIRWLCKDLINRTAAPRETGLR